ncbi:single-stranded DNA-binding protein [Clostridium sp.]|uniref:single-stranded DNA-binding protein n=1 Tax=Clostridium sp. TaxID=1506 RepID=UPI002629B3A0
MNKVDLVGRVATKIEVKESKKHKKYVRFRIAVSSFNGKEETTTFLSVITWSKSTVDFLDKFVKIGDLVSVSGEIVESRYESESGEVRYYTNISTSNINLLNKAKEKDIS